MFVRQYISLLLILLLTACGGKGDGESGEFSDNADTLVQEMDSLDELIESDYDVSDINEKEVKEFKENLIKIEKKHGVQWDFCTCVVKQDSINKALMEEGISEEEFDRRYARSLYIDERCKAFFVQNKQRTPEQRDEHQKKVRDCLRAAGVEM